MKSFKFTKGLVSLAFTTSMIVGTSIPAIAESNDTSNHILETTSSESDNLPSYTITENDAIRRIQVYDPISNTTNYIEFDKINNTIYSSYTNTTIDLNVSPELSPINGFYSDRTDTSYETKYISYASIKSVSGGVATVASLTAAILAFVPGCASLGAASSVVSGVSAVINNYTPDQANHGIKLDIKVTKYYRNRGFGRTVYKTTRSITGVSLY